MSTNNKNHTTIQSTMIGPLWARARYCQLYPDLFQDFKAPELLEKVMAMYPDAQDDFARLEDFIDEFAGLTFVLRAKEFDDLTKAFIGIHPDATIVNLGCGLDTTFSRVDNGRILWYDLDLPDAIEYRLHMIPETPRSRPIAKSVFDFQWFDDVVHEPEKGILFLAGGLLTYFDEMEVISLCQNMSKHFSGGELVFEAQSKFGNWVINRRMRRVGVKEIEHKLNIGNPQKQIRRWPTTIDIADWFPLFAHIQRNPEWKWKTRSLMNLCDRLGLMKCVHLRFIA